GFRDEVFQKEYSELCLNLPVSNGILKKIRNKYHHSRGLGVSLRDKVHLTKDGENWMKFVGFDKDELISIMQGDDERDSSFNQIELHWLENFAPDNVVDIKKLVVDHYDAYRIFLREYNHSFASLVRRKTGCEFRLFI
ncbi:MAG: hypothetical protein ACFBSG_09765, partial [Leptolyngbyaceae cyanobacterium]